jgi:hypothetical protein
MDNSVDISDQFSPYTKIDEVKIDQLREQHGWIVEPIYRASEAIIKMPFYEWLVAIKSPQEFKPAAVQLYYHSATFAKVIGMMIGHTSMEENGMMPFYAKHAYGEVDHHEMLMQWMLNHKILNGREEVGQVIATLETNACVNYAYQMAIEQYRDKWLVGLNCGIERCSNDFFKILAPKMHDLQAGDDYFDVHVEADEYHSIMGLDHIKIHDLDSFRGRQLVAKALEGISLWAGMLHSWIGITYMPKFDLEGQLIVQQSV